MRDTRNYVLWTDRDMETSVHLARRHLDAVSYLTVSTGI